MIKKFASLLIALTILFLAATPAAAITGGQKDGNAHPYGALLVVDGETFCSGTLIDEDLVLTAAHCAAHWTGLGVKEVSVTFDSEAAVDPMTWKITGGNWVLAHTWITAEDFDMADWPHTPDYALVMLDNPVTDVTPAKLPAPGMLDEMIGSTGQVPDRFSVVGYGQDGVISGQKPYYRNYEFIRKYSIQRYNPSVGAVGTRDPMLLILQGVPSPNKGGTCGGDSGSGVYTANGSTVVAVATGANSIGYYDQLCGRGLSLNHRVDIPAILDWIKSYMD